MATVISGYSFGQALCKHFSIDPSMVTNDMKMNCGSGEILSASMQMCLTADDIVKIGQIMQEGVK